MAEDGTEDDDVKEEYGKQMDETLAALRAKLEEAKHTEEPMSSNGPYVDTVAAGEAAAPLEDGDPSNAARPLDQSPGGTSDARDSPDANSHTIHDLRETIQSLQASLSELQSQNEREMQRHCATTEELRANLEQMTKAKEDATYLSQQVIASLMHDVHQLELSKTDLETRLQHSHGSSGRDESRHREATQAFERQIQEHEDARARTAEEHGQAISSLRQDLHAMQTSREREAGEWWEALEALQSAIQELSEVKEREIDELKYSLAAKHEDAVSKLRSELDNALAKGQEADDHKDELVKLRSQIDQVRATLGNVHASNIDLRQALSDSEQQHKTEVSELETALEDSKAEVSRLQSEVIAEGLKELSSLQEAKGLVDTALRSSQEAWKHESENAASLQRQLEQSQNEYQALFEKTVQVEQELKCLSGDCLSIQRLAADYQSELGDMQTEQEAQEISIAQLAEAERSIENLKQTVDALRQELYDKDLSFRELQTQMQALRIEHESTPKRNGVDTSTAAPTELHDLTIQLHDTQTAADKQAVRVPEWEAALAAECIDLQNLLDGIANCGARVLRSSSRSPRSAKTDSDDNSNGNSVKSDESVADEVSSSAHIHGLVRLSFPAIIFRSKGSLMSRVSVEKSANICHVQMAGVQKKLRQMGDLNDDLIAQEKK